VYGPPVLKDNQRIHASRLARVIGDGLLDQQVREREGDSSLASGSAGIALFLGYLSLATSQEKYRLAALRHIERAIEIAADRPRVGLFSGITGVAWVASRLARFLWKESDLSEFLQAVDKLILDRLEGDEWAGRVELMEGLAGIGVYLRERYPYPTAREGLVRVVKRLEILAERNDRGTTWLTAQDLALETEFSVAGSGFYNLGMAHGQSGVVASLAEFSKIEIVAVPALDLLQGAAPWLLSKMLPEGASCYFPAQIAIGVKPRLGGLPWCYGDLGVASALFLAGQRIGVTEWQAVALNVAHGCALRRQDDQSFTDVSLCHGAAGNGHIFSRLFHATGNEVFADAARFWFQRAVDLFEIADDETRNIEARGADYYSSSKNYPGLLNGHAGLGLALLSATAQTAMHWDDTFLTNIPGHQPR
jgi:lantibiotic modifying enzyme